MRLPAETSALEVNCLNKQWLDYHKLYIERIDPTYLTFVLKELNGVLENNTFFTGNCPRNCDKIIFRSLQDSLVKLSMREKERYIHLSRWSSHMQHLSKSGHPIKYSRSTLF